MSRKAILTCGYFSLNSVYEELYKRGYDIIKMRGMANPRLDGFCVDESEKIKEYSEKEVARYLGGRDTNSITGMRISNEEMQAVSLFGAGGRNFVYDEITAQVLFSKLINSVVNINTTYDYLVEANKKHNIKAILLHTAEGPSWGTTAWVAKELGIPTFCCYNGAIVKYIIEYNAIDYYNGADHYYLHGQYNVDWLERRINKQYNPSTMPIVGQPAFDRYYNKNGKIKKPRKKPHNTFLYSSAIVYSSFDLPVLGLYITFDMTAYSFYRDYIPSNIDSLFFKAFEIYQRNVNPDAKLVVALRPYYTITGECYSGHVADFGVKNFKVLEHTDIPFRNVIKDTRYVISGVSTVHVESLINRKPTLCLTGDSDRVPYDYMREWATISKTSNSDLIVEGLINMTKNEDELIHNCNKYATHFNYGDDGKAGERLTEDLIGRIT